MDTSMRDHIARLVKKYGSMRNVADKIGMDHSYLYRLYAGDKNNPSTASLKRLGLERQNSYRVVREP